MPDETPFPYPDVLKAWIACRRLEAQFMAWENPASAWGRQLKLSLPATHEKYRPPGMLSPIVQADRYAEALALAEAWDAAGRPFAGDALPIRPLPTTT